MAFSIKDKNTDELARRLAGLTGESLTEAVCNALRLRLSQEEKKRQGEEERIRSLKRYAARIATLPDRDLRSPEAIIGYNERGLPE